jgi:tRNA nucleotidyltransferase (CCA-adding enzyme)
MRLIKNAVDLRLIARLSGLRLARELDAVFRERSPLACFEQFQKMGILTAIHPALALTPARRTILAKLESVLEWHRLLYLHETVNLPALYLLAVTNGLDADATASVIDRFDLPTSLRNLFLRLRASIRGLMPALTAWHKNGGPVSALCTLLSALPVEGALYLMARAPNETASRNISLYINRWRLIRADIDGKDLRRMRLTPGPLYGHILREVWNAKLDGLVESRDDQLELARRLAREAGAEPM